MNAFIIFSVLASAASAWTKYRIEARPYGTEDHVGSFNPFYIDDNYSLALMSPGAVKYTFNDTDNSLYYITHDLTEPRVLRLINNEFVFKSGNSSALDLTLIKAGSDNLLHFNGDSQHFYMCRPLAWDPNGAATERGLIGVSYYPLVAPEGCNRFIFVRTPL